MLESMSYPGHYLSGDDLVGTFKFCSLPKADHEMSEPRSLNRDLNDRIVCEDNFVPIAGLAPYDAAAA